MQITHAAAAAVFGLTFLGLAFGKVGRRIVPRGLIALAGGLATALLLGLSPAVIDLQVILLLAGLMVLAALAETAGLFAGFRHWLLHRPPAFALWVCILTMALTSAALLNDAAVVVLVPFLVPLLRNLGLALVPSVTLLAVAANLGSLLTPFGNPQNAVLAAHAGLGVTDFLARQGLLVVVGLLVLGLACWGLARKPVPQRDLPFAAAHPRGRIWLVFCIVAFLVGATLTARLGLGQGTVAAVAASFAFAGLRIVTGREADRAAWRGLDWNVIALFVGLYFLTGGLSQWFPTGVVHASSLGRTSATIVTTLLSLTVGNVPAILTLVHLEPEWTRLHAAFLVTVSTLGGALLLTGSAASLLAADAARKHGIEVRFGEFLRWAVPTVLPVLVLGAWLNW